MLHPFDHGLVIGADHGDAQRGDDAGDGGVDSRIQHEIPQDDCQQDVGPEPGHAHLVEHEHGDNHRARCSQPAELDVRGIEQRDHQHGTDVVDDRHREQEQPQRCGAAIAEETEHAHCEGDVGGGRDRPAAHQFTFAADHADIDQRGDRHSGNRCKDRQAARLGGRQLAFDPFAFHLEPDDEEEHRHQSVVDPQVQVVELRDRRPGQLAVEQLLIFARKWRIGREHRGSRNEDEQDAGRSVADEERADGGKNEAES